MLTFPKTAIAHVTKAAQPGKLDAPSETGLARLDCGGEVVPIRNESPYTFEQGRRVVLMLASPDWYVMASSVGSDD